jgi:NAD(P)-dependent dehydrogenase (short-subunit alcohol dehydrogenase family)
METPLTHTSLLTHKHAVIFGAGGAVGTAMANEFAAQGATVFLSGRTLGAIEEVAAHIQNDGGIAHAAGVDALDEQTVNAYLDRVAQEAGSIDILLNAMGPQPKDYGNNTNTLELPLEQFLLPLTSLVSSQFITARAAARHMVQQHVVGIRSGAMVDTRTIQQSLEIAAHRLAVSKEQLVTGLEQATLLKRLPAVADTARLAAFLASDRARTLTGAIVNASSGSVID